MRPAQRLVIGTVLACGLGVLVHRFATPRPLVSGTRPSHSDLTGAPEGPVDPSASLVSPPAPSVEPAISPRIQLERQCLTLAEHDPLAAIELALKHNLTDDDPGLLTNLLMQWASRDFDAAYEWTKTQEAGAWRDNTMAHLGYLRAQTDPLAAARLVVADISTGPARDEAIISVVHQWALRDPEAAGLWAGALVDEALRQRAAAEVAGIAARHQ